MTIGNHGKLFVELFRKEKQRGGDALPKEIVDLAMAICKETHECDEVMLMLDENGYTPTAIAPVRKEFGEELVRACLEGGCVCGEAARYLDETDARIPDLAKMGCDDVVCGTVDTTDRDPITRIIWQPCGKFTVNHLVNIMNRSDDLINALIAIWHRFLESGEKISRND